MINPFVFKPLIPLNGLVSNWKFNEGSGSIITDSVSGSNGSISGVPFWVAGKSNFAISSSGDSYIIVPTNSGNKTSVGSMSIWFKSTNTGQFGYRGIFIKQLAYGIFLIDGNLSWYDWGGTGAHSSSVSILPEGWHHIVLTFSSGIANGTKLYCDGVLILTSQMTISSQVNPITIGCGTSVGGQPIIGNMDEAKLYNRILTQEEVLQLYHEFG